MAPSLTATATSPANRCATLAITSASCRGGDPHGETITPAARSPPCWTNGVGPIARPGTGKSTAVGVPWDTENDLYRQIGALLAAQSAHVVVDDINIAAIAGSRRVRDDVPASLRQRIDRRRFHAAPSRLRDAITAAARGGGLRVDVVAAKGLSRVHAECGHENPADDRYVSPPVSSVKAAVPNTIPMNRPQSSCCEPLTPSKPGCTDALRVWS